MNPWATPGRVCRTVLRSVPKSPARQVPKRRRVSEERDEPDHEKELDKVVKEKLDLEAENQVLRSRLESEIHALNSELEETIRQKMEVGTENETLRARFDGDMNRRVMENESLRSQLECASGEDKVLQDQIGRLLEDRVWPLEKENENLIEQLERTTMELEEQKRYFEIEIERIMRESMEELFSYHEKLDGTKGDLFSANEKLEEVKKQT